MRANSVFLRSLYKSLVGRISSPLQSRPLTRTTAVDGGETEYSSDGVVPSNRVLFTTSSGTYLLDPKAKRVIRLLRGKYYGLAPFRETWLVARSNNYGPKGRRISDVTAFTVYDGQIDQYYPILAYVPGELHQIDVCDSTLYVPHTGYNQLLAYDMSRFRPGRTDSFSACASVPLHLNSHSHLNSVFVDRDTQEVLLIAHNSTAHTGRTSDIVVLHRDSGRVVVVPTSAHSAHNICRFQGNYMYCDSNNRKLMWGDRAIFTASKLLRGLSATRQCLFIGGSDICFDEDKRYSSNASIYVLDWSGNQIGQLDFPGVGNLYEIRQMDEPDLALSQPVIRPT